MLNTLFKLLSTALLSFTSIMISEPGIVFTISENIRELITVSPSSDILAEICVIIVSSRSVAIMVTLLSAAFMYIPSNIGMVVLVFIPLSTLLTAFCISCVFTVIFISFPLFFIYFINSSSRSCGFVKNHLNLI